MLSASIHAQEIPASESTVEMQAEQGAGENGDDELQLDADVFHGRKYDLNILTKADLEKLPGVSPLQAAQLLRYRELFGPLITLHELQAVPGWDAVMIRRLIPYLMVTPERNSIKQMKAQFSKAEQRVVVRYVRMLERAEGYRKDSSGADFSGSPGQLQLRYRVSFKKDWQAGWLAEKDAGEPLLGTKGARGFDFNSFHFFARSHGRIHAIALGDFTVGMGQGLIQWQGMGTGKSADVMHITKGAPVLKPYQSSGEFSFMRGAGVTFGSRRMELTLFGSFRQKDANLLHDSSGAAIAFSSWNTSGLHRTKAEYGHRHVVSEFAGGAVITRYWRNWKVSLNSVFYRFGSPAQKRDEPYNIYAFSGRNALNGSISWSGNLRNLHFFGETAMGRSGAKAILAGLLMSVDAKADLSLLYRNISRGYHAVAASAFTASSQPGNENGIYMGICFRPAMGWTLNCYADIFRFPWLRYSTDGPSGGSEYLVEARYVPDKQTEIYTRIRFSGGEENESGQVIEPGILRVDRKTWRTQAGFRLNRALTIRGRVELAAYKKEGGEQERGFLWFNDWLYKPLGKPYSAIFRLQYFDTDSYASRIYAYENDIIYSYSLPGFSGRGGKCYLLISADLTRNLGIWVRAGRLFYREMGSEAEGPENIPGRARTELKIEVRWLF